MTPPNHQYPPPPGHQFRAPPAYPPPPPGYGSPQPRTYSQGYGPTTPGPPPPGQYPIPPDFAKNKKIPGKAIAGLVLGISSLGIHIVSLISMGLCCIVTGPIGVVLGIVGVILSGMAKKSIDLHPLTLKGRGFATAGQIMSGAGIGIGVGTVLLFFLYFLSYFLAYM